MRVHMRTCAHTHTRRLFLEVNKSATAQPPAREVLWEQDAWNDLVKSIELRRWLHGAT